MNNTDYPFVSIIIPALNEEATIGAALRAISESSYPSSHYEVIVVSDASTDRTEEIAKSYGATVINVNSLNVGAIRNRGAEVARGEFLAFLDADCICRNDWLSNAVQILSKKECVTGCRVGISEQAHWIEKAWYFEPQESSDEKEVLYINSGNVFFPTKIFRALSGFDESLISGEDSEICTRAKKLCPIISSKSLQVMHLGNPKTVRAFLKREIWHGLGALGSFKKDWRDKPLIATVLFGIFTLFQIVGGLLWLVSQNKWVFLLASSLIFLLVATSAYMKRRALTPLSEFLQHSFLYYVYFLGRLIALTLLSFGVTSYRRTR